jgi:hypothetical protein
MKLIRLVPLNLQSNKIAKSVQILDLNGFFAGYFDARFSWYFSLRLYRFFTSTLGSGFAGALAAVVDAGGVKNPVSTLTS